MSAPVRRSRSRDEGDERSDPGASIRARAESMRQALYEQAEEMRRQAQARAEVTRRHVYARAEAIRRKAQARAEVIRREARGDARRRNADSGSDRSRSPRRASSEFDEARVSVAGRDEARVSVAARERIRLLPGRRHVRRGKRALVRGYVPSGRSGRTVVLEILRRRGWFERDRALTGADGKFYLAWYPRGIGRYRVRVREIKASSDTLPSRSRLLYIYRRAVASWYGPGFYGNRTACGQTFTRRLLGVAHRSLPCGYRVTVRYHGRSITVPVVDRGPYVDGRDYDLTNATKEYLDFEGVDEIWATA